MKYYLTLFEKLATKAKILALSITLFTTAAIGQTYCSVGVTSGSEPITLVDFAGINNPSANSGGTGYQDFSAISGNVVAGTSYTITLKGNTAGNSTCYFRVYIDWNGDGDFFDAGESIDVGTIVNSNGTDSKTVTKSITVPSCDVAPTVRMRVAKNFGSYDSGPCSSVSYGEIEDYTLNISNPGGMTAYTVNGGDPDMPNAPVGLTGSDVGISYQLKKNGVNVGSPISGTGGPISFGNQSAGIYTVEAIQSGSCTKTMTGNVTVAVGVFDYTGFDQTYLVPPCATKIKVHIWGAGGGGGDAIKQYTTLGGGGGYTTGEIVVTPNESLTIMVGEGGSFPASASPYGGGGVGGGQFHSSHGSNYTGNGGGRSAIKRGLTELGTAGGGGGGGETSGSGDRGGYGGAGGGLSGVDGYHSVTSNGNRGGKGGTQSSGGAGGSGQGISPGSGMLFQGGSGGSQSSGSNKREGGGGGGGYYGGGGGAADKNQGGGGGGGSSYVGTMGNASTISGNATNGQAGNQNFEYNRGQYGVGGQTNASGKNGRVIIEVIEVDITAPIISAVTQTTCTSPTGSVVLDGLPASGQWTITQNPDQSTINGTGTTYTITGLTQGVTYSWSVTNDIGCTSDNSTDVVMDATTSVSQPIIASTAATCTAPATHTISNYDNSNTYTFSPLGPTVGSGGVISGGVNGESYSVTAASGGCSSTASNLFTISDQFVMPSAPAVTTTLADCSTGGVSTISNYDATFAYSFSPMGPVVDASGVISGMVDETNYTVIASSGSCSSASSVTFQNEAKLPAPTINVSLDAIICKDDSASLTVSGADDYTWSPSNGLDVPVGSNVIASPSSTTTYAVTGTNANGCTDTKTVTVTILPIPNAIIQPSVSEGFDPLDVTFTNASTNGVDYSWDFGNGQTNATNAVSISTTYTTPGEYQVVLIADNNVCADTTEVLIIVLSFPEIQITVPNVFTPNGDGKNDFFFIDAQNAKTYYVEIYNRWGVLMTKFEKPTDSWDGKDATDGTYFYKYKMTDLNDATFEGHGFLHLLR